MLPVRRAEAGVATVEDIDKAVVAGLSHPMGPLRLSDLIGLDTMKLIMKDDKYTALVGEHSDEGTVKCDPAKSPKTMDITGKKGPEAFLEIRDNGPGVPPERRKEIFKPYFTTHQKGTGLGLAVVQQIVLAHGWEIECFDNEPKGAVFRITHLKVTV